MISLIKENEKNDSVKSKDHSNIFENRKENDIAIVSPIV